MVEQGFQVRLNENGCFVEDFKHGCSALLLCSAAVLLGSCCCCCTLIAKGNQPTGQEGQEGR